MKNPNQKSNKGKQEHGKFHSKTIKHDRQAESARAKFGLNDPERTRGV
ncbi:MAG TPA: CPC_1213 family protein [Caproiciproducens sp.]|nr:CPC_1213 family protein [Caproiciproducens sp.]